MDDPIREYDQGSGALPQEVSSLLPDLQVEHQIAFSESKASSLQCLPSLEQFLNFLITDRDWDDAPLHLDELPRDVTPPLRDDLADASLADVSTNARPLAGIQRQESTQPPITVASASSPHVSGCPITVAPGSPTSAVSGSAVTATTAPPPHGVSGPTSTVASETQPPGATGSCTVAPTVALGTPRLHSSAASGSVTAPPLLKEAVDCFVDVQPQRNVCGVSSAGTRSELKLQGPVLDSRSLSPSGRTFPSTCLGVPTCRHGEDTVCNKTETVHAGTDCGVVQCKSGAENGELKVEENSVQLKALSSRAAAKPKTEKSTVNSNSSPKDLGILEAVVPSAPPVVVDKGSSRQGVHADIMATEGSLFGNDPGATPSGVSEARSLQSWVQSLVASYSSERPRSTSLNRRFSTAPGGFEAQYLFHSQRVRLQSEAQNPHCQGRVIAIGPLREDSTGQSMQCSQVVAPTLQTEAVLQQEEVRAEEGDKILAEVLALSKEGAVCLSSADVALSTPKDVVRGATSGCGFPGLQVFGLGSAGADPSELSTPGAGLPGSATASPGLSGPSLSLPLPRQHGSFSEGARHRLKRSRTDHLQPFPHVSAHRQNLCYSSRNNETSELTANSAAWNRNSGQLVDQVWKRPKLALRGSEALRNKSASFGGAGHDQALELEGQAERVSGHLASSNWRTSRTPGALYASLERDTPRNGRLALEPGWTAAGHRAMEPSCIQSLSRGSGVGMAPTAASPGAHTAHPELLWGWASGRMMSVDVSNHRQWAHHQGVVDGNPLLNQRAQVSSEVISQTSHPSVTQRMAPWHGRIRRQAGLELASQPGQALAGQDSLRQAGCLDRFHVSPRSHSSVIARYVDAPEMPHVGWKLSEIEGKMALDLTSAGRLKEVALQGGAVSAQRGSKWLKHVAATQTQQKSATTTSMDYEICSSSTSREAPLVRRWGDGTQPSAETLFR